MDLMRQYPDNHFDLAICDPPYGVNIAKNGNIHNNHKFQKGFKKDKDYGITEWDSNIPKLEYFNELRRVSKKQIIWGGNFFFDYLGNTRCVIVWDKRGKDKNPNFSPIELAWTNFENLPKIYEYGWLGFGYINSGEKKIHPTQKPVSLYRQVITDFAKQGDKILDTHLGSASIALACYELGFDLVASEINPIIYDLAVKRFDAQKRSSLFSNCG